MNILSQLINPNHTIGRFVQNIFEENLEPNESVQARDSLKQAAKHLKLAAIISAIATAVIASIVQALLGLPLMVITGIIGGVLAFDLFTVSNNVDELARNAISFHLMREAGQTLSDVIFEKTLIIEPISEFAFSYLQ